MQSSLVISTDLRILTVDIRKLIELIDTVVVHSGIQTTRLLMARLIIIRSSLWLSRTHTTKQIK